MFGSSVGRDIIFWTDVNPAPEPEPTPEPDTKTPNDFAERYLD